jgi:Ca2+-binding RTX toxin-like protein
MNGDGTCRPGATDRNYCTDKEDDGGNDRMEGEQGDDRMQGGKGNDRMDGNQGNDNVSGEQGNDRVYGNGGDDVVSGGSGNDRVSGASGLDDLSGGDGNDRIYARDYQVDTIRCGRGFDRVRADRNDQVARDCERVKRFKLRRNRSIAG